MKSEGEKRGRLVKAREDRLKAEKVHGVFRQIVSSAKLSRLEMLMMMESFPGICPEHIEYVSTAPDPDYRSVFEALLLMAIGNVAR